MKRSRIVIVDDEPITRMDIREMLEENGYEVAGEGKNGEEAVEKAYALQPDLIIMDVKMPERKIIEKAKGMLMQQLNCTEEQAHRHMQQESMKRQTPLIKLAEQVVQQISS